MEQQSKKLEQFNSLPIKEAQFKLKNQKDQISTVRLILMDQEFVRIQVFISRSSWEISLSLSQALKIHNLFFLINSIEGLFSYIEKSINAQEVSLETVDSLAHLTFNQVFAHQSIMFKITLKQVELNIQQIVLEMSTEFEENFKKIEEKHLEEQTKIDELQEKIQKFEFNSFSKILKSDEKDMVYKWVSAGKEVSHLELLYRASEHGFQAQAFHIRCGGKGPLICFVQSQNQRRFGGFIHLKFQKDLGGDVAANPNNSFLFSLDDKKQYLSNETSCSQAYYSHSSYGLVMGSGRDLCLPDNCNICSSGSSLSVSYGKNQGGNNQSLAGSSSFFVNEVEAFQIIYKQ